MKTLREVLSERQHAIFDPDGDWICVEDTRELAEAHAARSRRELAHFNPPPVLEVVPVEKLLAAYRAMVGIADPEKFVRDAEQALAGLVDWIEHEHPEAAQGIYTAKARRALAAMNGGK